MDFRVKKYVSYQLTRKTKPGALRRDEQAKGWAGATATRQPGAVVAFATQRDYRHGP
jgi:hypothetical protein